VLRAVHGVAVLGAGRIRVLLCFGGFGDACGVAWDGVDDGLAFQVCEEAEVGVAVEAAACAGAGADRIPAVLFFVGLECCGEAVEVGNALRITAREILLFFLPLGGLGAGAVPGWGLAGEAWQG